MNTTPPFNHSLSPFFGAVLFLAFVLVGAGYIIWAKLVDVPAALVTGIPLGLMLLYALALGAARYFRLRDDQAGDNLYYLGFLYTLTSLGVSLWQFSVNEGAEGIVTNFGVAIASTILGVALRVVFNQMRQDPVEVERTARLELADAARRVKRELEGTTLEFASFRRATQQMSEEALAEARKHTEHVTNVLAEPLKAASEQIKDTIDKLATSLANKLEETGKELTAEQEKLASTTKSITSSLEDLERRLKAMQMPDEIIEIKLQPFIDSLIRTINNLSNATADQIADLQKAIAQFDKGVRELPEQSGLKKAIDDHSMATVDQTADLQKAVAQFDKSVSQLAQHLSEMERRRSEDHRGLGDLMSGLRVAVAENGRAPIEMEGKVSSTLPSSRSERRDGRRWFRGRSP
jgi:archaellum component FlaC